MSTSERKYHFGSQGYFEGSDTSIEGLRLLDRHFLYPDRSQIGTPLKARKRANEKSLLDRRSNKQTDEN